MSFAETEWKVQGVRGTNPLKVKKKIKTTIKSGDVVKAPTIEVAKKPAFVKRCMKNLNSAAALANAGGRSTKDTTSKSGEGRYILDR